MVTINKSFIYGIFVASFTWIISIYLYFQLTNVPLNERPTSAYFQQVHKDNNTNNYLLPFILKKQQNEQNITDDLTELSLVKTLEDLRLKEEGYKIYAYNTLISKKLTLTRTIPDTRNQLCRTEQYNSEQLPKASVVICYYNEHYETLLRTIYSVIKRTPKHLLHEIILVDDFSDGNLNDVITSYTKEHKLEIVKTFRTEIREGLIRARLFGVSKAQGEVLVFLDSHVEVNVGWIEPLLSRIQNDHKIVVMPVIDIINADTFEYTSSPLVRGGFNWGLHFKWENLPKGTIVNKSDLIKPIKSPTMAGGLFAINRQYFIDMGQYDAGMNIWGGENLEISFRIWMCGGSIELIPCSRVGHIFRKRRPYGSPDGQDTMLYNSLRVAHVWLDDYKEYFLNQQKQARSMKFGDIESRIQLRKDLKCHDFDWYLKNVYPELTLPTDDKERLKKKWSALEADKFQPWHSRKRNYIDQFQIRLTNTSLCIQSNKDVKTKGSQLVLKSCTRSKVQMWYETDKHELVLAQLLCLQSQEMNPILYKCHEMNGDQEWKHKGESKTPIYNMAAGTCLGVKSKKLNSFVTMRLCSEVEFTKWDLVR